MTKPLTDYARRLQTRLRMALNRRAKLKRPWGERAVESRDVEVRQLSKALHDDGGARQTATEIGLTKKLPHPESSQG